MRKIRELLRLSLVVGLSQRQIAGSIRMGQSTVSDHLTRFRGSGLSWVQVKELDDETLEQSLFPSEEEARGREEPDWIEIHQELKRKKSVTLSLRGRSTARTTSRAMATADSATCIGPSRRSSK